MCFQVKPLIILEAIEMSSKFSSSHFSRTNGSAVEYLSNLIEIDEPTATVWWHISPTQPDYPGTKIPRSFEVSTPSESFWTHGNATEHMYDAVSSLKNDPMLKSTNPNLFSQFILYDYRKALIRATKGGVRYGRLIKSGHWTFKFSKNRETDASPVVIHALFTGLK